MKLFRFVVAAAALLQSAVSKPSVHQAAHKALHGKRQEYAVVTTVATVFVAPNGVAVSTFSVHQPTPAPKDAAVEAVSVPSTPPAYVPAPSAQHLTSSASPVPASYPISVQPVNSPVPASSAAPASNAPSDGPKAQSGLGLVYSPYNADHTCKTEQQVAKDFQPLSNFSTIRSYGVDCNQVPNIIAAAKDKKMKVMLGIFDIDKVAQEMQTLIQGVGSDWDTVTVVSVGNEVVNSKGAGMVQPVLDAVQQARIMLKSTPFAGAVVTVDTFTALQAHPDLCHASDFAATNAHAFFDSTVAAADAGTWLKRTADAVRAACGGKKVVVTETGWPTAGACNGRACPSPENQAAAVAGIRAAFDSDVFLFSAYDDRWKDDFPGSHGCEKFWGLYGDSTA